MNALRKFLAGAWRWSPLVSYGLLLWIGLYALLHHGLFAILPPAKKPDAIGGPGWEYKFEDVTMERRTTIAMKVQDNQEFNELLRKAGADGWELVSVMQIPIDYELERAKFRLIFKKPMAFTLHFEQTEEESETNLQSKLELIRAEHQAQSDLFRAGFSNSAAR